MASEDVAAGDGALVTWNALSPVEPTWPPSKTKSSTKFPETSTACARTPEGPRITSAALMDGTYLRRSSTLAKTKIRSKKHLHVTAYYKIRDFDKTVKIIRIASQSNMWIFSRGHATRHLAVSVGL